MKTLVTTTILIAFTLVKSFSQNLPGVWHGKAITPDNKEILFVFLFEKNDQTIKTTMAVPTFNVSEVKPKATSFTDGTLIIDGAQLGMKYEGVWNNKTNRFDGTYFEGNMQLKLNLQKGNPIMEGMNRPQEPVKPYPYFEEQVSFRSTDATILLSGTFTRPSKTGKYPVVVLISGSGRHDRDGSMLTHRPFLVLSDFLTRNNIAVLRYDDRGFGKSTGDFSKATTADFAQDVLGAVHYLKTRVDIDSKNIGLIGHSEGGIIAPLAANQSKDIAFIVSMAGTGIPGSEVSVMQSKSLRPFPVANENEFEKNVRLSIKIAQSNKTLSEKRVILEAHNKNYLVPILKSLGAPDKNIAAFIENETTTVLKPWNVFFYNYNPADEFEKLQIPVLSINGSKDVQVDAKTNQSAIRKALIKGKNKDYSIKELAGLNHLFQECKTGEMKEYKEIKQTISPIALKEISSWILQHSNK